MKKNIFLLLVFILFPLAMLWADQLFYVSFASRVMIYAIAATSLNLVLGYGGMISFGHAAFVGTGAYVGSILVAEGVTSAFVGWPAAIAASALAAWLIGAISLRTRGVYFIMITLAFAQMMFYLVNSMKAYGGDEGLTLRQRPYAFIELTRKYIICANASVIMMKYRPRVRRLIAPIASAHSTLAATARGQATSAATTPSCARIATV